MPSLPNERALPAAVTAPLSMVPSPPRPLASAQGAGRGVLWFGEPE